MQTPEKGFIDPGIIETDRTAAEPGLIAYYKFDDDDPPTTGATDGADPWEGGSPIDPEE